jgi:hypothetical protein
MSPLVVQNAPFGDTASANFGMDYTDPPTGGTADIVITTADLVQHRLTLPFDAAEAQAMSAFEAEFGEGVGGVITNGQWPTDDFQVTISPGHGLLPLQAIETDVAALTGGVDVVGTASDSSGSEADPRIADMPLGSEVIRTGTGLPDDGNPLNLWKRMSLSGDPQEDWVQLWSD